MSTTVAAVVAALAALEDPKVRAVNERHGDDHGVNLTKLRAAAKEAGMDAALARELWATGKSAPRLVALLVSKPKDWTAEDLDRMLREARIPKITDWLINYHAKKSAHAATLRDAWLTDPDPRIRAAGWSLTTERIVRGRAEDLDLPAILTQIETALTDAPAPLQWSMNETLAQIGIHTPALRRRAIEIGERLGVLRDYPTPPNCTSPFAPLWIAEMVRRREG